MLSSIIFSYSEHINLCFRYALGGYDGDQMLSTVEIFDPRANSWRIGSPFSVPRGYGCAVTADDNVYLIGGSESNGETVETVWFLTAYSGSLIVSSTYSNLTPFLLLCGFAGGSLQREARLVYPWLQGDREEDLRLCHRRLTGLQISYPAHILLPYGPLLPLPMGSVQYDTPVTVYPLLETAAGGLRLFLPPRPFADVQM